MNYEVHYQLLINLPPTIFVLWKCFNFFGLQNTKDPNLLASLVPPYTPPLGRRARYLASLGSLPFQSHHEWQKFRAHLIASLPTFKSFATGMYISPCHLWISSQLCDRQTHWDKPHSKRSLSLWMARLLWPGWTVLCYLDNKHLHFCSYTVVRNGPRANIFFS